MSAVHELPTAQDAAPEGPAARARPDTYDFVDDFGDEDPQELIGQTLAGRYELLKLLGTGGMGAVYLGRHVVIDKLVAVKVLGSAYASQPEGVRRFLREAKAASRIRHENVVDITDFGEDAGTAFMVMEFLEGEDLSVTLIRTGALPWPRAVGIGVQIAAALSAAHEQGVVHRDMKPENCYRIARGGSQDFIKVLDFGIAKLTDDKHSGDSSLINAGSFQGTPEYVAPELLRGALPDPRVDIYAVGVILYKLVCGSVPFYDENFMEVLNKQLFELPEPPRQRAPAQEIPASLERVILRCLEKDPAARYPSIAELVGDLRAIELAAPRAAVTREGSSSSRSLLVAVFAALALLLAGVLAFVLIGERQDDAAAKEDAKEDAKEAAKDVAAQEDAKDVASSAGEAGRESETSTRARDDGAMDDAETTEDAEDDGGDADDADADVVDDGDDDEDDAGDAGDAGDGDGDGGDGDEDDGRPKTSRPAKGEDAGDTPKRLSYRDFANRMSRVTPRNRCSKYGMPGMKVKLKVTVGPDGRVKSSTPIGSQSGSSLGSCVARSVRLLKFPKSQKGGTFRYTYKL